LQKDIYQYALQYVVHRELIYFTPLSLDQFVFSELSQARIRLLQKIS